MGISPYGSEIISRGVLIVIVETICRNEYDRGVNTFSPEGRLWQIDYAMEAIKLGSTAIAIQTTQGVVFTAEKRMTSKLMEPQSVQKIFEIDYHIGCALSGLVPDARTLISRARVDAQNYSFTYDRPIAVESVTQSVCDFALKFGENNKEKDESTMSRPFGVSLLIGGIDEDGPVLFHTDPAGNYIRYLAKAVGNGSDSAQNRLEKQYNKDLTLDEAKTLSLLVLREVMEDPLTANNVEVAYIDIGTKRIRRSTCSELEDLINSLPASEIS